MLGSARGALSARITVGMRTGQMPDNSAAIARLISAVAFQRQSTISLELAGPNAAASLPDDRGAEKGFNFLERQSSGIGGGTTEMARNNISEKVLRMPRRDHPRQEHAVPRRAEGSARQLIHRTTHAVRERGSRRTGSPSSCRSCVLASAGGRRRGGRRRRRGRTAVRVLGDDVGVTDGLAPDGLAVVVDGELPVLHLHVVQAALEVTDLPEVLVAQVDRVAGQTG